MPLLKRKPHVPLKPPADLRPLDYVYQIRFTKEIFCDYHGQYLSRMNLYRQRLWTCKMTGKISLTFEEALVSEQRASEKVKRLPSELVEPALRAIQFCMLPLRDLVHEVTEKLQEHLYEGIELYAKKDNVVHLCKLLRIIEKGSGVARYEVEWLDTGKENAASTVVNGEDLIRKKFPITREVLKAFIRESTYQSMPWVLHDNLAKKYGIRTSIPDELRSQVFLDVDQRVCNRTKKNSKGGKEKTTCKHKNLAELDEDDQSRDDHSLIKYPIDDLWVRPSFDDPMFTERPLPSFEFVVPVECSGDLLMVWDFCSSYGRLLHLWPFSLDDFENAICRKETNLVLLVEAHSALLQFLIKDGSEYAYAIHTKKRKSKITLLKWAEYLCDFLEMIDLPELRSCISTIRRGHYGLLESDFKARIFRELVDHAIATESFREKIDEYVEQRQELGASRREEALEDAKRRRKDKEDVKLDSVSNGVADEHIVDGYGSYLQQVTFDSTRERNGNVEGSDVVYRRRRSCDKSNDPRASAAKCGNGHMESELLEDTDDVGKREGYKKSKYHRREYYEMEMEKRVIRVNPLGTDRHFNRYWWFHRDGRIFFESSDSKQWGFYSSIEELDAFMGSLNLKGIRERALFKKLKNYYQRISSELQRKSQDTGQNMTSDDSVVRRSTRVRAPPGENPANSFLNYENRWKEINV